MSKNRISEKNGRNSPRLYRLTSIALAAVIICVCSWVTVPGVIPFTLQTMGVFFALGLLGGRDGTVSAAVYLLLGAVGLPVYSGFGSGIGHLFGATGGYMIGFLLAGLFYWLMSAVKKPDKMWIKALYMLGGLIICYLFGTLWFSYIWTKASGDFVYALSVCVVPFIIPDLIKLALAALLSDRVGRALDKSGFPRN